MQNINSSKKGQSKLLIMNQGGRLLSPHKLFTVNLVLFFFSPWCDKRFWKNYTLGIFDCHGKTGKLDNNFWKKID